jgi:Rrf2 family protein
VKKISEAERIPHHFLAKIMNRLISKGMVRAMRGPGGGFVLAKPPGEILVRNIIDTIDGVDSIRKQCVLGLDVCRDDAPCPMHEKWKAFRESFLASIEPLTLENLAENLRTKRQRRPPRTNA